MNGQDDKFDPVLKKVKENNKNSINTSRSHAVLLFVLDAMKNDKLEF